MTRVEKSQSQLRDVDKLLKLDPGNTELLAQKHRLLGDAVKETKEKLETMNIVNTQMYIDGYQVKLVSDTSYGSLWEVSFTLKEF